MLFFPILILLTCPHLVAQQHQSALNRWHEVLCKGHTGSCCMYLTFFSLPFPSQLSTPASAPRPPDVSSFLSFPSPDKLLKLGAKRALLIEQQVNTGNIPWIQSVLWITPIVLNGRMHTKSIMRRVKLPWVHGLGKKPGGKLHGRHPFTQIEMYRKLMWVSVIYKHFAQIAPFLKVLLVLWCWLFKSDLSKTYCF